MHKDPDGAAKLFFSLLIDHAPPTSVVGIKNITATGLLVDITRDEYIKLVGTHALLFRLGWDKDGRL